MSGTTCRAAEDRIAFHDAALASTARRASRAVKREEGSSVNNPRIISFVLLETCPELEEKSVTEFS